MFVVFFFFFLIVAYLPPHCICGRWEFGNLLMSCWVQAPEPARTLGESLALAAVMWETGLWPLDSCLYYTEEVLVHDVFLLPSQKGQLF